MSLQRILFIVLLTFLCPGLNAQTRLVSGFVRDSVNGEKLVNAYVVTGDLKNGIVSNNEGYFSMRLSENQNNIIFSYVGYSTKTINFAINRDTMVIVELSPNITLKDIIINATTTESSRFRNFAITEIPIHQIKYMPAMLGEVDLFKTIQLFPGVSNTWAGFSGLVVRGGNSDQNLILVDDIPIYSYSHFYGLFSVINENALQSVRFMKGAIPARYGGRLSSVVDVTLKEGNKKNKDYELGIGLMSSSFLINGPLKNEKTTFSLSGRRSMSDLISVPYSLITNRAKLGSYFGDFSGKITHSFSKKDKMSISFFTSIDKYYDVSRIDYTIDEVKGKLTKDEGFKWGNYIISIKHNHIQSPVLTFNNSIYYSSFFHDRHTTNTFKEGDKTNRSEVIFASNIKDFGIRSDWQYNPHDSHRFFFGVSHTLHQFKPGASYFYDNNLMTGEVTANSIGNMPINLSESVAYLEYDFRIVKFLTFNIGVRASLLNSPDTLMFFPEPRFSGTVLINPQISTTFFYTQTNQYFHFLRSSILDLPTDLWIPATKILPSEKSKQWGIEANYKISNQFEISIASYYKDMMNLVIYKEGSSILPTENDWEGKIELGKGSGYGVEFFAHKKEGRFSGFLSYTLSWSKRQFDNINRGKEFYSSFDRRHELSITTNYNINEKWRFGLNWLFNSGTPYSLPAYWVPQIILGVGDVYVYEEKNTFRLPSFHRLDIGVYNVKPVKKHPERQRTWSASIYNAYNQKNPYYRGMFMHSVVEANLFLFLPSISYKLKF